MPCLYGFSGALEAKDGQNRQDNAVRLTRRGSWRRLALLDGRLLRDNELLGSRRRLLVTDAKSVDLPEEERMQVLSISSVFHDRFMAISSHFMPRPSNSQVVVIHVPQSEEQWQQLGLEDLLSESWARGIALKSAGREMLLSCLQQVGIKKKA